VVSETKRENLERTEGLVATSEDLPEHALDLGHHVGETLKEQLQKGD
jgi:hypothetical protein